MGAIPANFLARVTPGVLGAGGTALDTIGLILTNSTRPPIGGVLAFASAPLVGAFFGLSSQEYALSAIYFLGFDNSNVKPASLLFAQYPSTAVSAYMRSAALALTVPQLQGLGTGSLTVSIDNTPKTAASINLSAVTSQSQAAGLIATGLGITGPTAATFTGAISGTTLTVSAMTTGTLAIGDVLSGSTVSAGTTITAFGTGSGTTGTYTISATQNVASAALTASLPGCSYDSVTGTFVITSGTTGVNSALAYATGTLAAPLGFTQATGATLSQGAAAATPAAFMTSLVAVTTNWASFMTTFEPSTSDALAFASWVNSTVDDYIYVSWDTDVTPTQANDTSSLGYQLIQANYSGTVLIWLDPAVAAFAVGFFASLDFTQTNGRATLAFRGQSGLNPTVTNGTVATNLVTSGYNYYGSFDTANDQFNLFQPGRISGPFVWADSYINQLWMNNEFQLAMMTLLQQVYSIPYNAAGKILIEAALQDVIDQAVTFGAIRPGVTLSNLQIAEVNAAAGMRIDDTISLRGWYLIVGNATPQVRVARTSPPLTFFYCDGGLVQQLALSSIELQ